MGMFLGKKKKNEEELALIKDCILSFKWPTGTTPGVAQN